jgi:hypothetical protein
MAAAGCIKPVTWRDIGLGLNFKGRIDDMLLKRYHICFLHSGFLEPFDTASKTISK